MRQSNKRNYTARTAIRLAAIVPAAAAMSLSGLAYAQTSGSTPGGGTDSAGSTQPVDCAEGRKLMLLEYWAFVRNNPECRPTLDQDKVWTDSLSGFVNAAPDSEPSSGYGSGSLGGRVGGS